MSEITIFLLYAAAAVAFGGSRLPRFSRRSAVLTAIGITATIAGILLHGNVLANRILTSDGINLSLGHVVSLIGFELAVVAVLAAAVTTLRGISAGLLLLAVAAAAMTGAGASDIDSGYLSWQSRAHILIALSAFGLLTVGAIVAVYAMLHNRRLRHGQFASPVNNLFAPLETTERLLISITAAGFVFLAIAITLGLTFVENLFAQHLVHKSTLASLALLVFGALLVGRWVAGWRGTRAVKLYLAGYLLLVLAYFGSRVVLEQLSRSWS